MENLQPAISKTETLKEMPPQEFQRMLSTLFEEKGIVSDLKSQAKYQMINILRNTSLGKTLCRTSSQTSLSQQALHLVVAEYLLKNQCHYSFSLFNSEVNLAKIFPESKLLFNTDKRQGDQSASVFDKENLTNILDLIGISKGSEDYKKLIQKYFESEQSSVLTCLINIVSLKDKENACDENIEVNFEDEFLQKVSQILISSNIPQKTYAKIIMEIKKCYEIKTKTYEDQCLKLITKFREEISIRNQKLHSYNKKKKRLEKQLLKTTEEQKVLKEKVRILENNKELDTKETPREESKISCGLDHCSETCKITKETCQNYQKENEHLKDKNTFQANEIKKLKINYNNLKQELINCQSKINLLKFKLQDQSINSHLSTPVLEDKPPGKSIRSSESDEGSSNNLTEEVLKEARHKLRQLEEESEQIELKYKSLIIR